MMHYSSGQNQVKPERIVPDNTIDTQECNQHTCGEADIQGSPDQPEQRQPQST